MPNNLIAGSVRLSREIYHKDAAGRRSRSTIDPFHRPVCLDAVQAVFYRLHFACEPFIITEMRPHISEERCTKCGECVRICPYEVFQNQDGNVVVAAPEDCIECTACEEACPQHAVSMDD